MLGNNDTMSPKLKLEQIEPQASDWKAGHRGTLTEIRATWVKKPPTDTGQLAQQREGPRGACRTVLCCALCGPLAPVGAGNPSQRRVSLHVAFWLGVGSSRPHVGQRPTICTITQTEFNYMFPT